MGLLIWIFEAVAILWAIAIGVALVCYAVVIVFAVALAPIALPMALWKKLRAPKKEAAPLQWR
jgi:hypothetical protein